MWDDAKQKEFNALREREGDNALTEPESQRLAALYAELDEEEWRMLSPGLERQQREIEQLEIEESRLQMQNALLAALHARQGEVLARAHSLLHSLSAEQALIQSEVSHVLGSSFGETPREGARR